MALDVPEFETGGTVERTGIGPVDEGEHIVLSPGSEALVSGAAAGTVVNYHFPVEIEVVGAVAGVVVAEVVQRVFDELDRELSSRQ